MGKLSSPESFTFWGGGVSEGRRKRKEQKTLFEGMMAENFPTLGKEPDIQVWEAQRAPNRINPKRPTPRHPVVKMGNGKDKKQLSGSRKEGNNSLYMKETHKGCQLVFQLQLCRPEGRGRTSSKG